MGIVSSGGFGGLVTVPLPPPASPAQGVDMSYVLNVTAALLATTTDAQTNYWGCLSALPPGTTAGISKVYIPKAGTIKVARIIWNAGTAGTNQSFSMYIRVNNTTDTLIATVADVNATKEFSNTNLNIPVIAGDYIEIKNVFPTWTTNPANVRLGGVVYVE